MNTYDKQAKVPSRWRLKRAVKALKKDVIVKMKDALKHGRRVSSTVDIWSSRKCKDSYLGVTCHFLNMKTRKRENYRLSCRLMNCPHTGLNTAKMIKKIFKEYEVEEKMFRTITDNASSMIKAARDLRSLRDGDEEDLEYSGDENEVDESDHNY